MAQTAIKTSNKSKLKFVAALLLFFVLDTVIVSFLSFEILIAVISLIILPLYLLLTSMLKIVIAHNFCHSKTFVKKKWLIFAGLAMVEVALAILFIALFRYRNDVGVGYKAGEVYYYNFFDSSDYRPFSYLLAVTLPPAIIAAAIFMIQNALCVRSAAKRLKSNS